MPSASTLHLPPGPWTCVLDGLCARFPHIPRATWVDRFARGRVQDADGRALAPAHPYRAGLCVRYFREVPDETPVPFGETVLHADADLVVADKPHFLPVTPAGAWVEQTLLARLRRRLGQADLVPLHRIDRETAGLVLFSPNPSTRAAYQALFRERRIDKRYEALAPPLPGLAFPRTRRSCLVRGEPFFRMQEAQGEPNSETRIEVLERARDCWRYALFPVGGRKHQLRVHMASLGAPILGDRLYPAPADDGRGPFERPLQLLARSLAFDDPLDGRPRRFESARRLRAAAECRPD